MSQLTRVENLFSLFFVKLNGEGEKEHFSLFATVPQL